MREAVGSIWTSGADAIVIPTNLARNGDNGVAIMGAGLARQARDKIPYLSRWLGAYLEISKPWVNTSKGRYAATLWVDKLDAWVVAFPTKRAPHESASLDLIRRSMNDLIALTIMHQWESIALPRVGCGYGGLDWEVVRVMLQTYLDDRFTVYSLTEEA